MAYLIVARNIPRGSRGALRKGTLVKSSDMGNLRSLKEAGYLREPRTEKEWEQVEKMKRYEKKGDNDGSNSGYS